MVVDDDTHDKLVVISKEKGIPMTYIIRWAIKTYVLNYKSTRKAK